MNEGVDAAHFPSKHRRRRREPAHAEDDLRFVTTVNRAAAREAFIETANKTENGRGERRGQSDAWKFFEGNFGMLFQGQGVDIFFGNEEQHVMAALPKHLRHGQAGKQMAARSTTCDDCVHFRFKFEA